LSVLNVPTHCKGHTLDLVIANYSFLSNFCCGCWTFRPSSNLFNIEIFNSRETSQSISFRKWQSIDHATFVNSIVSSLDLMSSGPLEDQILVLNNVFTANLDISAPIKTRNVSHLYSQPPGIFMSEIGVKMALFWFKCVSPSLEKLLDTLQSNY